ncbi:unnamed protein product [Mytilus edulis]|uniref:Integrase catalytic domain-containing protein n=1 Tax=Mytilus edulis TaxID=6550 RepID=A0A8S3TWE6_MYTED|nr:unnamed protein product [Mytilus edulis]
MGPIGIAGYNCKVEYIAGTANFCADLLSRIPTKSDENNHVQETDDDVDFDDKAYEVGTLNSNSFDSRRYASCHLDEDNDLVKPDIDLHGEFSMEAEQAEDGTIASLKKRLQSGTATKTEDEAFAVPDKSAENIVHLLIEHIFPRYGSALQLLTDNGTEFVNESTSPVSYKLKNQLTDKTTKALARHIRPTNLEWDIPKENLGKPLRKSVYVVPPNDSDDGDSSDVETSKAKMTKWPRYERQDWSSEDDIPL